MQSLNSSFERKASVGRRNVSFEDAYDLMFAKLKSAAAKSSSLDKIEPQIRECFTDFLDAMNLPLAKKNFEQLMKEKSGEKFRRSDGSVSWFHEFIPLLTMMTIIRRGSEKGGIDLKDLDAYGGLEVLISTHLRHDSVEDHTNMKRFKAQLHEMRDEIKSENPHYNLERADHRIKMIVSNVALLTQKKIRKGNEWVKEDVRDYSLRMVADKYANPIVFMLKQTDIIHNFATMFGAEKFTPEKILKRCNEREDQYGPRQGFTDRALDQWPKFREGILCLDSMMGFELYPIFRYLESVPRTYKTPHNSPVGIYRFVNRAVKQQYPDDKFNPIHIFMKRMVTSVDPKAEPEKHAHLGEFLKYVIKPALKDHREHFPYLFSTNGNGHHHAPARSPA